MTLVGTDFGGQANGRRLVLRLARGGDRGVTLSIERWTSKAIEARIPSTLPAGTAQGDLVLVDQKGRVLGRAGIELLPSQGHARGADPFRHGHSGAEGRERDETRKDAHLHPYPDPGHEAGRGHARSEDRERDVKREDAHLHPYPDPGRAAGDGSTERGGKADLGGDRDGKGGSAKDDTRAGRRDVDFPDPGSERDAESRRDARVGRGARGALGVLPNQVPGGGASIPRDEERAGRYPFRPALVLGGGGSRGAFQVGVLQNLYARGMSPTIITGTSVGALAAAKLAEGGNAIDEVVQVWREITGNESIYVRNPHLVSLIGQEEHDACGPTRDLDASSAKEWFGNLARLSLGDAEQALNLPDAPQKLREALMDINALDGLHLQRGLASRVAAGLSPDEVARSGIKLRLTATERSSGDLRYFTENGDIELANGSIWQRGRTDGSDLHEDVLKAPTVADGVLASSAIPMFFSPWYTKGGEAYWDGAVREGLPIHKALQLGATDLVTILTGPRETPATGPPKSYTLTIERVRRAGKSNPDDGSSGDYFARVKWGHNGWKKTNYYENDRDVAPRWRFEGVFGEILVSIKDYDFPDKDDACDASPEARRKELRIDFDPRRFTDAQHPGRFPIQGDGPGQIGDLITVVGGGDDDPVEVSFRIRPGTSASSGYTKGIPGDLAPLAQAMTIMGHQGSEVSATDLADLDQLDVLHELAAELSEGSVVRAVKSFPLPRDIGGRAYMVPNYVLIEPPFVFGDLPEFEPEVIDFNIELGNTIARWTRVDFLDRAAAQYDADGTTPIPTQRPGVSDEWLEQQKRAAAMGLIQSRIDTWRARERAGSEPARCWRERYEALQAKATDLAIRPFRRAGASSGPAR